MIFLWLPIGLLLPTVSGWLIIRLLEGTSPVLLRLERWVLGFVLGTTLVMYTSFLLERVGLISFTLVGFLIVQLLLTLIPAILWYKRRHAFTAPLPHLISSPPLSRPVLILSLILGIWMVLKLLMGSVFLTVLPVYQDDVYNNWNLRGKIFYVTQELTLTYEKEEGAPAIGVSSYPPTVPLIKTWLSTLAGQWHDGLVNAIHLLWYLSALILVFFSLRRMVTVVWALIGVYMLGSLPLYLMHGTVPYADIFLSVHLFAALSLFFYAIRSVDAAQRNTFFRLSAFASALLIFTKNEALLLHFPPLILLLCLALWQQRRKERMTSAEVRSTLLWYAGMIAAILIPWLLFKWTNDLPFGNAKPVSGLGLSWQSGVAEAIWINTFFEGNWLFLFPLFFGLLIVCRRLAFRTSLVLLTSFFLIVYFGQFPIYFLTPLSTEAINQTGYARGLIQLMPVVVVITTVLLSSLLSKEQRTEDLGQRT